jgi:ribosomal peptide maturation radical SAM protein 1
MTRVALITMPVVAVNCPSISLTQLKSAVKRTHGEDISVEVLYLSHDFSRWASEADSDIDLYKIFTGNQLHNTGLADWFFRQAAFPELPDNSEEYFARYYPGHSAENERFKAALIEKRKHLDSFLDDAIDRHRIDECDVVGFTSMFQQNGATFALARRLKERNPNQTIVVGGANCEPPMGQAIIENVDQIDYVFAGPALVSFPEFLGKLVAGDLEGCREIQGVLGKGESSSEACVVLGEELDIDVELELDYDDFMDSLEAGLPDSGEEPIVFFETSRGCWWGEKAHCTFCGLNGVSMKYRSMAPEKALNLINGLFERYGERSSYFFSVDNIIPTNYVSEVIPYLQTPPDARVFYEVKADLSDEDVRVLSEAGVKRIQPGIESMATSTLKLMKKGTSVFTNLRLLKSCLKYGVSPQWNLLIGFPGEGEDVYQKYVSDLPRLVHLPPPDGTFPVRFDRFSPYYTQREEYGLDLEILDYYRLIYPFDEKSLSNLAYYFIDRNFDAPYFTTMVRWIGRVRKPIELWHKGWADGWGAPRAKLYLERNGDGGVVHDTRGDRPVEHALSDRQVRLLSELDEPRRLDDLRKLVGPEVDGDVAQLDERGLVWEERGRYLSLVLPSQS